MSTTADKLEEEIKSLATVTMPIADQFWGDRYGHVKDPFGFSWAIATHIEDPTPAEIQEREAKLFGSGGTANA